MEEIFLMFLPSPFFCLLPLFGMTQRLHCAILAETAKFAQLPGRGFSKAQNP
jgi:hypothetical protein